jgi:hypothetical protein
MASTAAESTRPDMPPPGTRHTDGDLTKSIDNAQGPIWSDFGIWPTSQVRESERCRLEASFSNVSAEQHYSRWLLHHR